MNEPSEKLMDLVFLALDHGVDSVRGGGPLIPFLFTDGREKKLERFVTERIEQGVDQARQAASSLGDSVGTYAIAHDGYVTIDDTKFDAVLVEAAERGASTGFVFAQRYKSKKGILSRFKTIGNAAFVGEAEQRFK